MIGIGNPSKRVFQRYMGLGRGGVGFADRLIPRPVGTPQKVFFKHIWVLGEGVCGSLIGLFRASWEPLKKGFSRIYGSWERGCGVR